MSKATELKSTEMTFLTSATGWERFSIQMFCKEVNRRAEANMIKTGKLEGSHYAAMNQLLKELGI